MIQLLHMAIFNFLNPSSLYYNLECNNLRAQFFQVLDQIICLYV